MSYLINLEIPALNTMRTVIGVSFMTQRNSFHARCAVRVEAVIESLAVEHIYAPILQLAMNKNVYLSTLVMTAQKTLSAKETMCSALILSVKSSVILETLV